MGEVVCGGCVACLERIGWFILVWGGKVFDKYTHSTHP